LAILFKLTMVKWWTENYKCSTNIDIDMFLASKSIECA
jgi:hypothetical protein